MILGSPLVILLGRMPPPPPKMQMRIRLGVQTTLPRKCRREDRQAVELQTQQDGRGNFDTWGRECGEVGVSSLRALPGFFGACRSPALDANEHSRFVSASTRSLEEERTTKSADP